jgi:hypothetical protein
VSIKYYMILTLAVSRHKFASNVVEKAIKFSNPADRRELISELIGEHTTSPETRVATLLRDAYGNFPVQTALAAADADQRDKVSHGEGGRACLLVCLSGGLLQILSILIPLMPDIRQTPCGRRLDAKIAEYEARSLVPMPIPPLSHSLSSSSVNLPDLANDSDAEAGTPVGAVASLAGITVAAITPVASPVSKGNGKNNKKDNGGLRRVVTLPSDEDDLKTLLP